MNKLYYRYIGARIVHFEYYIDNKRIELPKKTFTDLCANCAAEQWIKDNDINDTDIELCPAPYNTNEKLRLIVKNYEYGVCFQLSLDNQIINQTFMTGAPSIDAAIKEYCYQYGLERELIEVQETTEDVLNLNDLIVDLS